MKRLRKLISGCVALVVCTACTPGFAQVTFGSATQWLDGKALEKARSLPVSISWTESPLRSQLTQFGVQRQRPIFVDRRVDPTTRQTLQLLDVTTEQVVWQIAAKNDLGVARVGNLLYVGPKSYASNLRLAIDATKKDLSKLGKDVRKKWSQESEVFWPHATSTTEVASWFESNHGIRFEQPIPFDVWPQTDLPKLTLLEQMTLVLVGFDRSLKIAKDGHTISLIKFPVIVTGTRKFKTNEEPFDVGIAKSRFAELKFSKSGRTVTVKGDTEQIADLQAWIVEQQKVEQGDQLVRTFDLNTTARRGDILATAAEQTGRKLELVGRAGELLAQPITVNLQKATLETLIGTALEGTGLRYNLSNSTLTITDN